MDVSVIIPCYNAEKYINKCLDVLLNDKLEKKEIIVINDGSTDKSLNLLNKYKKKYKNIVFLNQKNREQDIARNNGLKIAKGKYITFVDIDDYPEKNMLYEMFTYAKNNNYDYVYCNYIEEYTSKQKKIKNYHTDNKKKDAILANFAPWGKLIAKELIEDAKFSFYEGKIFEDIAVIPYLAAMSKNPGYLSKYLYHYNMSNNNSTTRKKYYDKRYEDMIFVSDYLYNLLEKNNLIKKFYDEISFVYLDGILKSGVLKFADYKEGLSQITILRKNVKEKFKNLLKNKYYKKETIYHKLTTFIAYYFPPKLIYTLKRIK